MKIIISCKTFCMATTWALLLVLANLAFAAAQNHEQPIKSTKSTISTYQIPHELITRQSRIYDASFAVSVKTVLNKLKQKQSLTLVDVRRPEEFARLKIPGSINIPLHAIKTKSYLKIAHIVLISNGFGYKNLENECRRLNARGFKTSILDGGLPAWERTGGLLVGDLLALEDIKSVSPQLYFMDKDFANTLVIDISARRTEASSQLIPDAKHLPVLLNPEGSLKKLRQLVTKYKNESFFSVLIFNETGKQYANVEKYLNRIGLDAFYLEGGLAGCQKYLAGVLLSWKPRGSRIKTAGNCKPCGKKAKEETRR